MSGQNQFELQVGVTQGKKALLQAIKEQEKYFKTDVINSLRRLVECEDSIFNYCDIIDLFRGSELFEEIVWHNIATKTIEILNRLDIPTGLEMCTKFVVNSGRREISVYVITKNYTVRVLRMSFDNKIFYPDFQSEEEIIAIDMFKFAGPINKLIETYRYKINEALRDSYITSDVSKELAPSTIYAPVYGGVKSACRQHEINAIGEIRSNIQQLEEFGNLLYNFTNLLYEKIIKELGIDMELLSYDIPYENYETVRIKCFGCCEVREHSAIAFLNGYIF